MSRIDLHTHSSASDGTLSPDELVRFAFGKGVRLLALTDHDTVDGVGRAASEAASLGMLFVPGVEVSTLWNSTTIHVVGLGVACGRAFSAKFDDIGRKRTARGFAIAGKLEALGISGSYDGAMALASGPETLSRAHFARWLASEKIVSSQQEAFDKYLGDDCPAFVETAWPSVAEGVAMIREAGGVAVLAHPGRYRMKRGKTLSDLVDEFTEAGGEALEVCSGSQNPRHEAILAEAVRARGLWASLGSDFHSPQGSRPAPGGIAALPEDLEPVWRHIPGLDADEAERLRRGC